MYFFIEDTATTEIYTYRHTLSLHNALPISATPASIKRLERGHDRHRWLAGEDSQPVIAARSRGIEAFDQPFIRSEEHTSELQSLMRITYAVFCLNKQTM